MMTVELVKLTLSSDKDQNWEVAESLRLEDDALQMMRHACLEVIATVQIELENGLATIVEIDGRKVE